MRTTKPKYAPIDATVAGIPAEEPVFLLRAQDQHAVATLRHYADRVQAAGGDPNLVSATRQSITEFAAWPVKKAPDLYAAEVATGTETAAAPQGVSIVEPVATLLAASAGELVGETRDSKGATTVTEPPRRRSHGA